MKTQQIREKVQSCLVRGEIEDALNLLISGLDGSQQRRDHDNALMLKAKWENIKQEQLRGTLSRPEYELAVNKIIAGIQTITNEIDYAEKSKSEFNSNRQMPKTWLLIIPAICILGLLGWYLLSYKPVKEAAVPASTISKIENTGTETLGNSTTKSKKNDNTYTNTHHNGSNKGKESVDMDKLVIEPVVQGTPTNTTTLPLPKVQNPTETKSITIFLNGDDSKLKIDDNPIPGSGIFKTNLTLGEHKFEIIETSRSQKCTQKHTIYKETIKLSLTCN